MDGNMSWNFIFLLSFLSVLLRCTNAMENQESTYGTDPDPISVDKTPGFFHNKGEDFKTRKKRENSPVTSTTKDLCSRKNRIACVSYFTDYPDKKIEVFNSLPSNCKELQLLGHQTSGFYLAKGIDDNLAKIENIYCEFRWNNYRTNHIGDPMEPNVEELRYGYLDIHSSSRVFFHVQRSQLFSNPNSIIPFEIEKLNEGKAMDLESGVFTATKSGIYHFSFVASKFSRSNKLAIYLRKNEKMIGQAMGTNWDDTFILSLTSTLKMKEGDTIDLFMTTGTIEDAEYQYTHFTGWIIEEHLEETNEIKIESSIQHVGHNTKLPSFVFNLPSSCDDLDKLGHKLGGFYLVRGVEDNRMKVEIIYCDFKRKNVSTNTEKRYGYVNIYSSSRALFYVQKTKSFSEENAIIPFELAIVNGGGAMNLSSGIFTVPKNGVYYFSFAGMKDSSDQGVVVYLRKNGVNIAKAQSSTITGFSMLSFASTLYLKVGESVDVYKTTGNLTDTAEEIFTHFTGWIIEEDLNMTTEIIKTDVNATNTTRHYFPISKYPDKDEGNASLKNKPTSCQDLQLLGYKISGIYLVNNTENETKSSQIQPVYCNFNQSDSQKNTEKKYGIVQIHSSPRPAFSVQKKTQFAMQYSKISFEIETLNIGSAMNLTSGIFTAPKSGIYHFSFTVIKDKNDRAWHSIFLRKNGENVGVALATGYNGAYTTSVLSTLKLNEGDKIDLYKETDIDNYVERELYTQFTGWLVE